MNSGFLVLAVILVLLAAACLLLPLLGRTGLPQRAEHDLAVYRDQLAEVDRDLGRGLIDERQAEAARLEVRRRILRAAGERDARPAPASRWSRAVLPVLAVALPLLALAGYTALGRPDLPSVPFASRHDEGPGTPPQVETMVASLEERLRADPSDVEGWLMLGRSRSVLGRMDGAVEAYRTAYRLAPGDPRTSVALGEALMVAADSVVTPEAAKLFQEHLAVAGAAADPRAGYYLGVADAQAGNAKAAIQRWRDLLAATPADAPWRGQLLDSIETAARTSGIDPKPFTDVPPAPPPATADLPAPSQEQMADFARLSPEDRAKRIAGMVDGLEARLKQAPDDVGGWIRLGRARAAMRQPDQAAQAFEQALRLKPDDPDILASYGEALIGDRDPASGLPQVDARAQAVFRRLAEKVPADPRPWWYLGVASLQQGDNQAALADWEKLLERMAPDHPDRATIEGLVATLKEKS